MQLTVVFTYLVEDPTQIPHILQFRESFIGIMGVVLIEKPVQARPYAQPKAVLSFIASL